jgi:hypothetical protein
MLVEPIHVATIRGHQLRFFKTPNNDGRPDMPWHSHDDLIKCVGLGCRGPWKIAPSAPRGIAPSLAS